MVVQWEDRFHAANRAHTYLGPIDHPEAVGLGNGITPEQRYPDFVAIAAGFGWGGRRVLDVQVPYQEHVLPMIPAGATVRDLIKE